MRSVLASVLAFVLAAPLFATADQVVIPLHTERGKLTCGDTEVHIQSSCMHFAEHEGQCVSESLQLTNSRKNISIKLPHDGKRIRQSFVKTGPVLDAHVTGWACIKSVTGTPYIYIFYTCVEHPKDSECYGTNREWGRVFSMDGKNLTAGVPRRGPAAMRRQEQLGIPDSIQLHGPTD